MISRGLQTKFQLLEMAAFQMWQRAGPRERKRIAKALGEFEAQEILKEIKLQSEKQHGLEQT